MSSKDNLGDKLKDLENNETSRKAIKGIPLMARLDGRGFSKFTKGLKRPYDERMSQLMIDTTKYLVLKIDKEQSGEQISRNLV